MKLATARGMRSFTNAVTTGSSRNAIVIATTMVMKKTRPKYSRATRAAIARKRDAGLRRFRRRQRGHGRRV